jgi:hypothetical protein
MQLATEMDINKFQLAHVTVSASYYDHDNKYILGLIIGVPEGAFIYQQFYEPYFFPQERICVPKNCVFWQNPVCM